MTLQYGFAHVCIHVTILHTGEELESTEQFVLDRKSISRDTTHPHSWNLIQLEWYLILILLYLKGSVRFIECDLQS